MEAVKGTTKTVLVDRVTKCSTCKGSGMKEGKKKQTCRTCGGSGVQTISMGGFHMQTTCSTCGGAGSSIPPGAGCFTCDGVGRVRERKAVQVSVPPGVDQNSRIRVSGEGDAPIKGNGPNGDLFVSLNVSTCNADHCPSWSLTRGWKCQILPSSVFKRQNYDVFVETKIPFYKAILGGQVRIPTIDGDVELKIPSGSQPGDNIALRGRGIQRLRGTSRGDQIVTIKVELPRSLKGTQREIIEKYASLVDPAYRKDDPAPSTSSDNSSGPTPPPSPKDNDCKDGFFKNAFGKLRDKLNHDDDKKKDQMQKYSR